jgi:hypothetical protein
MYVTIARLWLCILNGPLWTDTQVVVKVAQHADLGPVVVDQLASSSCRTNAPRELVA